MSMIMCSLKLVKIPELLFLLAKNSSISIVLLAAHCALFKLCITSACCLGSILGSNLARLYLCVCWCIHRRPPRVSIWPRFP